MSSSRNKLYITLFIACLAGYIWLCINLINTGIANHSVEVCIVKHVTGIPCPSCGSTRSVISLTKGDFHEALFTNPLGYLIGLIMLVAPLWISFDVLTRKSSLYEFYKKTEFNLKKLQFALPLLLLVIFNWIWNISKGL